MSEGWQLYIAKRAEKYLKNLPDKERILLIKAIDLLANNPYKNDVKKLKGRPEWSLRVGNKRILLRVDAKVRAIIIVAIGSRGDIYK